MTNDPAQLLESWAAAPENTARSVLVTIFGDTVLPVGESVWLAQLFKLTELFGFSGRLVRTSLFRLAAEGWFTNERVGRQSRYVLTPLAIEESEQAEQRIYHSPDPDWTGEWTVVFLEAPIIAENTRTQLAQHLHWQGFISLSRGIIASPNVTLDSARDLCDRVAPGVHVPLASLEFHELDSVVADGFFVQALAIDGLTKSYDEFTRFYETVDTDQLAHHPAVALGWRTMLIHDLRRIKLSSPDIPVALLPADWPGTAAHNLARDLYPVLSAAASPWLSELLEVEYPRAFPNRFT